MKTNAELFEMPLSELAEYYAANIEGVSFGAWLYELDLAYELALMDAEMEREGVEDATAWEHFPEYERILYALAESQVERDLAVSAEVQERDELIELVELADENAKAELGALGDCGAPFDTAGAEEWPDTWEPGYFDAWHDACNDWFTETGILCTDEVLGLA